VPGAAGDLCQHVPGGFEREVVQQHHHLLPVGGQIGGAAHDQGCGQQLHFLHRHMAVHPVRARHWREVIRAPFARCQQRHRQAGYAVLRIGRNLAVPVNDGLDVQIIGQID